MTETFSHIPASEIQTLVADFKNTHHIVLSNYFGVKESDDHEILVSAHTLLLRKKEHDFQRLFLLSSDEAELVALLKTLDDEDYVLNIPTKKGIGQWEQVLSDAGFTFLAQYDRYYNREIEYRESDIGTFATEEDADEILGLLYVDEFSIYTDYLPTKEELMEMIKAERVLVNKEDGHVLGVLIFTLEGKKCYLNIWIDRSKNGLYLLFDVYNIMVEKGVSLAYFWVRSDNKKIIKLHKLTGAVPDGLSDYSFIKQAKR